MSKRRKKSNHLATLQDIATITLIGIVLGLVLLSLTGMAKQNHSKLIAGFSNTVVEVIHKDITCDWSRECVESYIDQVFGKNSRGASWAKYTSAHEGGYNDQYSQANYADKHFDGRNGSFGQFQFAQGTYEANCEPSKNWKMDWRAQVRCAKKLWDNGSYQSHWFNNTKGWNSLASK